MQSEIYTKNKTRRYIAGTEFNNKRNIKHYVRDRTVD